MRDLLRRQWHEFRLNLVPREFLYWLVQNLLLVIIKMRMRVEVFGGDHYQRPSSATLILSTHKRDWDPLICATHLYYQRGWWRPDGRRMAFVGRDDMFSPGFMSEIVGLWHWPRWASWLLNHLTLTPIIGPLRAYPIARPLEYSTRQYLFELRHAEGNLPLTAIFSDEFLDRLDYWAKLQAQRSRRFRAHPSRSLRVNHILTWDYREPLMERLRRRSLLPERYEAYKTAQREKIARQVQALLGALVLGDTLWLAPEGMITQDGAPRRVRGGLHALLGMMPRDARMLPVNVTYDFMTTDRMRACLSVGPPLEIAGSLERGDLGKAVSVAITGQAVVTMSMLGSRFLWERLEKDQPVFTSEEAQAALAQNMLMLAKQGVTLEQGLRDAQHMRQRLRAFLAYCLRRGLLTRQPGQVYRVNPAPFQQQRASFFWLNPRYCVNELMALEAALAQREGDTGARG